MSRILLLLITALLTCSVSAAEIALRDYDEWQVPSGYHIPVISLQEFSTAITEEGELLKFITSNDIFMFDKKIIPQGSKITGFIEKKNEPIRGTNASMKIFLNKLYLPNGEEVPIKAYIYTPNDCKIGGELTQPETYNKMPHYQRWAMFRAMGTVQYVPGDKRKMGEHVTVSSGANLTLVLIAPINMTHSLIN